MLSYKEWLPDKIVSNKFLIVSILLFPIVLLVIASFQPKVFFEKGSIWNLLSANVFYLHTLMFAVLIPLVVCKFGGLKLSDVGLKHRQFFAVILIPIIIWLAEQIILAALVPFNLAEFKLNSIWLSNDDTLKAVSSFFANMVGTGLNEETFFRGYVFTQLYSKFGGTSDGEKLSLKPLLIATLISAVVFAVMHLQVNPLNFLVFTIGGIIGCILYARTRNLFVGIGVHAVFNSPMPLLQTDTGTAKIVVISLMIVMIVVYPILSKDNKLSMNA